MAISGKQTIRNADIVLARSPKATYSQNGRGSALDSPHYDCSSFIAAICNPPGGVSGAPSTVGMKDSSNNNPYKQLGYTLMSFSDALPLGIGDILIWNKHDGSSGGDDGHTAMIYNREATLVVLATGPVGHSVPNVNSYYGGIWIDEDRMYEAWQWVLRPATRGGLSIKEWRPGEIRPTNN